MLQVLEKRFHGVTTNFKGGRGGAHLNSEVQEFRCAPPELPQFFKEHLWGADDLSDRDRCGTPLVRRLVITSQDEAALAIWLNRFLNDGLSRNTSVVTQHVMQVLAGKRQKWAEQCFQTINRLQANVNHGPAARRIAFHQLPRLLRRNVLIGRVRKCQGFLQRSFDLYRLQERANFIESSCTQAENFFIGVGKLARLRHSTVVAMSEAYDSMDEVSPSRDQFVIVAANEFGPIPTCVSSLRRARRKIVPDRICGKLVLNVVRPQRPVPAGAHLLTFEVVKLVCGDVVGQV